MYPPRGRILHHDEEHVLGRVDHDIDPGRPVPLDLAERARRWRIRKAGIDADAEAVAKTKAVAGIIIDIAGHPRPWADVIRGHRPEGGGTENGLAVQRSPVQQHLAVACEVSDGRDHAAAAGFPARD